MFYSTRGVWCENIFYFEDGGGIFLGHLENVELSFTQPQSETVNNYDVVSVWRCCCWGNLNVILDRDYQPKLHLESFIPKVSWRFHKYHKKKNIWLYICLSCRLRCMSNVFDDVQLPYHVEKNTSRIQSRILNVNSARFLLIVLVVAEISTQKPIGFCVGKRAICQTWKTKSKFCCPNELPIEGQ